MLKLRQPKYVRRWLLILIDLAIILSVFLTALLATELFAASSLSGSIGLIWLNFGVFAAFIFAARASFRIYSNVWRYANSKAYLLIILADAIGGAVALCLMRILETTVGAWESVSVTAMATVLTLASRFCYQQYYRYQNVHSDAPNKINVAIVGAGQLGSFLAEELLYRKHSHYRPVCFIDTNTEKIGGRICGLKVYSPDDKIIERLRSLPVQEVFIALPTLTSERAKELHDFYSQSGCKVKLYDFPLKENADSVTESKRIIREVDVEDLLFRKTLNINSEAVRAFYTGKVIMVTGGGGSIGSELCTQIAKQNPKKLIILDIYENNAYDIQQKLRLKYGRSLDLEVEIASVRDPIRMEAVFAAYRPEIVFHAAAHKHVPLMEHSACEAIKNNVLGTYNTANLAEKYGTKRFILISTDKAVNPTNIMGASKRMCEMVIQCRTDSETAFAAVRFGNVLGSNGSVIPLFRSQIRAGGPVTVTDKRVIRYFMTIPEASQLVMQAGAMAKRGDLFVLDMGNPVKILDLAENMIRFSGYKPYEEIDIQEVGLRPGEKLYEELLIKTETLDKTENNLIFIEHDTPFTREEIEAKLTVLKDAVKASERSLDPAPVKAALKQVVDTFRDPEEVNSKAYEAAEMQVVHTPQPALDPVTV